MPLTKKSQELPIFLSIITILIIIGFVFIYSSSSVFALERFGSASYFVKKQVFGFLLGLCAIGFIRIIPTDWIQRWTPLFFLSSLFLTFLTLIPIFGVSIHGSRRWLALGPASFQPSELLKIGLIMYIAYLLAKKEHKRASFISCYIPFLFILGISSLILLRQPDFGLTVTLCLTAFILFFIAQFQLQYLAITLGICFPLVLWLIIQKPYRLQRIFTFLNPWQDPQGSGFQIIQSLIAIGSGSISGLGIGESKQKFFYLPMQHTDFIFSIIAEETGFIGSCILIFLYALFLYVGLRIAWQLKEPFHLYTTIGFVLLISLQTIINILVVTGLVPTKGIGLPFISYGISSLVASLCMIGIIINFVLYERTF